MDYQSIVDYGTLYYSANNSGGTVMKIMREQECFIHTPYGYSDNNSQEDVIALMEKTEAELGLL